METSGPISDRSDSFYILGALAGLVVALLAVGVVSHLLVRHVVQVTPAVIAAVLVVCGGRAARYAALPIFLLWLFIMAAIWLFLLGVARIVTGTFTTAETVLTVIIGLFSLAGIAAVLRRPRARALPAIVYFVAFAALQCAGLWMSMRPRFARR